MLLPNADFYSLMLTLLSMSSVRQLCCVLFKVMSLWCPVLFEYLDTTIEAPLWSIIAIALVTIFTVRMVLHREILLLWLLMGSPPFHAFVSSRLSFPNSCKLGMLMTLQWLGLGLFSLPSFPLPYTAWLNFNYFVKATKSVLVVSSPHQSDSQAFFSTLGLKALLATDILGASWVIK